MKIPIDKFENWLINKDLKKTTVEEYLYYFNRFVPYGAFTQENVSRLLSKKENRNGVCRSFLANFKKFLTVNYKELELTQDNRIDISEVELPRLSGRAKQRLVKPLTEEQILEVEKHLEGEEKKLKLLMSYYGGLRVGELYQIKIISFNWEEWGKDMNQIGECRVFGKGNKEGLAFFPPSLMKRIAKHIRSEKYASPSSHIFIKNIENLDGIKLAHRIRAWQYHLKEAGIKSGITQFDEKGKIIPETKVHPHKLRHSWGYHLKTVMNMDIRDIQEILRHSSITSTQRYTYTDKSHLKKLLTKNLFS